MKATNGTEIEGRTRMDDYPFWRDKGWSEKTSPYEMTFTLKPEPKG